MSDEIQTDICNLAIGHLGISERIVNAVTEKSKSAKLCRVFFDLARDETFRGFDWPFATRFETLQLLETDPLDGLYGFLYRYPNDSLKFRKILSNFRVDTEHTRVKYKIASDDIGQTILTDRRDAISELTILIGNSDRWPVGFRTSVSYRLADFLAAPLTSGDPTGLGKKAMDNFDKSLSKAESNASGEEARELSPDSEFIDVRDGIAGSIRGGVWQPFPGGFQIS